jgi:uncharacterized protein (TIGR01777 family)
MQKVLTGVSGGPVLDEGPEGGVPVVTRGIWHAAGSRDKGKKQMRILITGSSGLVGSALLAACGDRAWEAVRLVRKPAKPADASVVWAPGRGRVDTAGLEGLDGVVHLAGESVASGRWTEKKKQRILESRERGTRLLCETLARLARPPKVLVSASAIGYYGDRGEEELDENSLPGTGFLAGVCRAWEGATEPASAAGIRVVRLRIGLVLSAKGGALARILPTFKAGVGGVLGSGRAFVSWVTLADLIGMIQHALETPTLSGPVNAVSPNPVTNRAFTKTLGEVLNRPTVLPVPAFAIRLAFGEMGEELLLASARVAPRRLLGSGFAYAHPELEPALRALLGRRGRE